MASQHVCSEHLTADWCSECYIDAIVPGKQGTVMENMQSNVLKEEATVLDLTPGTSQSISKQFHNACKFKGFIWIMFLWFVLTLNSVVLILFPMQWHFTTVAVYWQGLPKTSLKTDQKGLKTINLANIWQFFCAKKIFWCKNTLQFHL